jgi:glycosyltransferase involved in cell wall biosynthesis
MSPCLSAIICTHNPRADYLNLTVDALRRQAGHAPDAWELIVVDNASSTRVEGSVDLSWHPRARVVREERLGLTHARMRGFREAGSDLLVFIDDDNVLDDSYISHACGAMGADASLGAIGGKVIPRYEVEPPFWFRGLGLDLACRDLGDTPLYASWDKAEFGPRTYPVCAPIGAGMVIRRAAFSAYSAAAEKDPARTGLGRKGADLASGEDNDMIMTQLSLGWRVAYLPELRLEHLIPAGRLSAAYLASYAFSSNLTWVRVLDVHGIRPWTAAPKWSVPLRKVKSYLALAAWRDDPSFIRWRGACGLLEARGRLARTASV